MLTTLEKQVIAAIQGDMPITERPYERIAEALKIDESLLLQTLDDLVQRGVMRRFGATLRHQKSGFKANAMTAWRVDEDRIDAVGKIMAGFKEVSHCYRRDPKPDWPYNLYTMIHGLDEQHCREAAAKMAAKADVDDYCLLFSRREFKKTSMKYFDETDSENLN
ncbi:MAG: Lrp/AsnC family transcriptional regulator [Desulfobacteraceae bacterium]|jgi:DNA-binding Lrp family transcriptional regulator